MSDSSLEDYLDKLEDDLNKVDSLLEEGGFEPYFCAKCLRMCRQKDSADEKKLLSVIRAYYYLISVPQKDRSGNVITDPASEEFDFETEETVFHISWGEISSCVTAEERLVIPERAREISYHFFKYCPNVTSLVIPDSFSLTCQKAPVFFDGMSPREICVANTHPILMVRDQCLYNKQYYTLLRYFGTEEHLHFENSAWIRNIGKYAFCECTGLKSVAFDTKRLEIEAYAFQNCISLKSIKIKGNENKCKIHTFALKGCTALTEFVVEGNVSWMGADLFEDCVSLEHIEIGWLDEIENDDCYGIEKTPYYANPENYCQGILHLGHTAVCIGPHQDPGTVTELELPERTVDLGKHVFAGMDSLKKVCLPKYLRKFSLKTLKSLPALEEISVDPDNPYYRSDDGILYKRCPDILLVCPSGRKTHKAVIREGTEAIEENAFSGCLNVTEVVVPSTVTKIGWKAFFGCENLKKVLLTEGLKRIEGLAFAGCKSLTQVTVPGDSLEMMDESAFDFIPGTEPGTRICLGRFEGMLEGICIRDMSSSYHTVCDVCMGALYYRSKEYFIVAKVIHIDEMLDAYGGSRGGWSSTVYEEEEISFGAVRPTREDIKQYYLKRG
ncbi:MAG: leucine-rich repeat domain-containing protein [Lachnospiraceae bacterium]|nr:leucine-rich repeat domain-containing protein [Lachnospiraceae bacterium]